MKETLRRLAAWVMSLLMILNGLPVTALAEDDAVYDESAGIQLLSDAQAQTRPYNLYFYALIPGQNKDNDAPGAANKVWNGLGIGTIYANKSPQEQGAGDVTTPVTYTKPASFPNLTFDGVTYKYAAPGTPEALLEGYYTLDLIRIRVADGANEGNNKVNRPEVASGTLTYHIDYMTVLNRCNKYTVQFLVKWPDETEFVSLEKYANAVDEKYAEADIVRPSTADVPETKTGNDGTVYDFDGWYKDEACTEKANFDGTITSNTKYYGKYVPKCASYKVEYYLQDVGADGKPTSTYTLQTADTVTKSGTIGSTATYEQKSYNNYTFKKAEPANPTIKADGSLVIKVYYTRDTARLTILKDVVDPTTDARDSFPVTVTHDGTATDSGNVSPTSPMFVTGLAVGETFTVTERDPGAAWTTKVGDQSTRTADVTIVQGDNTVTFTNSRTLYNGDGRLTVTKQWLDGAGALDDQYIPASVGVQLLRNGVVYQTATLEKTDGWAYTFENLPATNTSGAAYTYTVKEANEQGGKVTLNGYRFTVSGVNQRCTTADVTITNTLDRVNVVVTKAWELNGIDMTKPTVTFTLKQGSSVIGTLAATATTDVYTLTNVPYRTDYTVDESLSGGTVAGSTIAASTLFTPQTGVTLTGTTELTATVTNTAGKYGITISKTATWDNGMDVTIPTFTFTVDGKTVTLQPVEKGVAVSKQVLVNSSEVTVEETPVTGWTANATSIKVSAGGTAAFTNTRRTLSDEGTALTITKEIPVENWILAMANDTFDFTVTVPSDLKAGTPVTYTVAGGTPQTTTVAENHTFVITGVKDGQTATVTSVLPTGAYSVQETANADNAHAYNAQITNSGYAFTATNTPVTNSIAFTKQWEQPNGAQPAENAYGATNATATFCLYDGDKKVDEKKVYGGTVTFENVPTGTGKTYTIRETALSGADNYTVSNDVLTAVWDGEKFVLSEGDTITNPLKRIENWRLSLTKQVENNPAADAGATFTVRYSYKLPGATTAETGTVTLTDGQTQDVVLTLPVGTKITVEEVLTEAEKNVWDTYFQAGDAEAEPADSKIYTVSGTGLDVIIINDRVLFGTDGTLTLSKTWVDNNDADKLRPDPKTFAYWLKLYSKAGEDDWKVDTVSAPSVADDYTITYAGLPAYDLEGNAMSYAVAETVEAPYALTYTKDEAFVMVAEGVQAITSGGFINTLENGLTITKLWRNSENAAIPAAQETQVELKQNGTTIRTVTLNGMGSTQSATVSVPKYDENGSAFFYTIHEVGENDGVLSVGDGITYTVAYDGLTVTNTKDQPGKTAKASEVVNIDDGGDGIITMVPVGATITFTIGYENYLPEKATVTVTDTLPVGLKFVAEGSTPGYAVSEDGQTVTWTLVDVDPLTSGTITLVVEVTEDALTGADPSVRNTASVTLGNVTESTATTDNKVYNPDWTVEKTISGILREDEAIDPESKVLAGDVLTYAITVTNIGNCDLSDLKVEDTFLVDGENVELTLVDEESNRNPASFDLAKGETKTFHASYVVKATDKVLSNTVTSEGKEDEVITEVEDAPAWTVEKYVLYVNGKEVTAEQTYNVGDKVTYAITVTNAGNCDVKGLKAADLLSGAADMNLKLTGTRGENPDSFTLPRYADEQKQPGTVTFLAVYTLQKADKVVTNVASIDKPDDGKDPETDKVVITVEDYPDVELVKTVDNKGTGKDGAFRGGDTIRYRVEVRNTGNCLLENLKVEDVFEVDGLLTELKLEPAAGRFDLKAGESKVFCASYVIQPNDTCLANEATVSNGETEGGDRVIITTEPNPSVTVLKEVTNIGYGLQGAFLPGDEVDYRVTVTNNGNCDLYDLTLIDSLYGDDTRLKITLPEEAASFNLMKGETIVFKYSYRTQEGYSLLVNTAKVLDASSRVKTRIVTDPISPAAMPPAYGYTSNVGDCFD